MFIELESKVDKSKFFKKKELFFGMKLDADKYEEDFMLFGDNINIFKYMEYAFWHFKTDIIAN